MDGRRTPLRSPFDPSKYGRPPPRVAPPASPKEAAATEEVFEVANVLSAFHIERNGFRRRRTASFCELEASVGAWAFPELVECQNLTPRSTVALAAEMLDPSFASPMEAQDSSDEDEELVSELPPHLGSTPAPVGGEINKNSELKGLPSHPNYSDTRVNKVEPAGPATPGGHVIPNAINGGGSPAASRMALDVIPVPNVNGTGVSSGETEKFASALPPHMRPAPAPIGGAINKNNEPKGLPSRLKFSDPPVTQTQEPKENSGGTATPDARVVSGSNPVPSTNTNGGGPPAAPRIAANVNTSGMVFNAWPVAEHRGRAPSQKRSVLLQNVSTRATLADLSAICKNTGVIERFDTSPLESGKVIVHFVDQETADRFLQRTGNGIMYKNTCVFVEPQDTVDVLSGRLREAIEKGARRIIRIVGIEDTEQLRKAYKELLGGSVDHLKSLDETELLKRIVQDAIGAFHIESVAVKKNKAGFLEGRIVWGKTDIALKAFPVLRKLLSLEGCNIQYFDDP
jgi:hypothetical protein